MKVELRQSAQREERSQEFRIKATDGICGKAYIPKEIVALIKLQRTLLLEEDSPVFFSEMSFMLNDLDEAASIACFEFSEHCSITTDMNSSSCTGWNINELDYVAAVIVKQNNVFFRIMRDKPGAAYIEWNITSQLNL